MVIAELTDFQAAGAQFQAAQGAIPAPARTPVPC